MNRLLLLTLLAIVLAGCGPQVAPATHSESEHAEESHSQESVELTDEQKAIAGIKTQAASLRVMSESLEVPGTVSSTTKGRAVVTPPVGGKLVSLLVQPGDQVNAGETIAVIESAELAEAWARISSAEQDRDRDAANLKDARSQAELAQAKVKAAEQTLKRQQDLAQAGAFNTASLQQAQRELNDAQNDLLAAQKELATHEEALRRLENLFKEGLVSKSELQEAQLDVQKDEIEVSRAESTVRSAKSAYDREKSIADKGLLNAREVQTAEAEVRSARLEFQRMQIAIRSAESALQSANKAVANARSTYRTYSGGIGGSGGRTNLVAPISGTVSHLDVTRGQAVDRTQTICEIENLNSVWVTANVPERDAAKVRKGATVEVTTAGLEDITFRGIVQVVGSRLDEKTRSIPVQCLVSNENARLKPGMFAQVHIEFGASVEVLAVLSTAIVEEAGKSFIFVREGDGFVRYAVEVGRKSDGFVEIISGIEPGADIATEGGFVLKSQLAKDELKGHDH
ncbi:MAG: efflux RND transporter periplasmic adaptor subunit [Fimbriimonadaceae bacterium]|nr:MAG: efflux RND transporter periplasmic adaptor subunit [Fimbriimonadaceae bacterium]